MSKINKISVLIVSKQGLIKQDSEYKVESFNVVAENDAMICIDDGSFTTVSKRKDKDYFRLSIDKPSIYFNVSDNCFGTSVRYTFYTYGKKRPSTIQSEIKAAIDKKFGALFGFDLSFIKDGDL